MKVKIIGAGSVGNHLAQASRRMGWNVAVVDSDPSALLRMKNDIYPKRYGAWDEKIELFLAGEEPKGGFDIIMIGTPPDSHISLARSVLKEKPRLILIEKPLATPNLKGVAEFLLELEAYPDTIVIVGYNHAVSESVDYVFRLLELTAVGQVETIDVEFREHWQGIFSAHPWLSGPKDSYLGFWERGGGAGGEHSHALHLWLLLAKRSGLGIPIKISVFMDMKNSGGTDYDSVAAFTFLTNKGKIGRVIQDVVTLPPRKWARIQGEKGFIEWICNGSPEGDIVRTNVGAPVGQSFEKIFSKKRPDDFYRELLHIEGLLKKFIRPEESPLSLASGISVMKILANAYLHQNATTNIVL